MTLPCVSSHTLPSHVLRSVVPCPSTSVGLTGIVEESLGMLAQTGGPVAVAIPGRPLVLIAEDEEVLREHAAALLESEGYAVLAAATGAECLEHFEGAGPENVHLVVLDYNMPVMNGIEAFCRIRKLHAAAQVLFNSGCLDAGQLQKLVQEGARGAIPKPYTARQYLAKVREVLGAVAA